MSAYICRSSFTEVGSLNLGETGAASTTTSEQTKKRKIDVSWFSCRPRITKKTILLQSSRGGPIFSRMEGGLTFSGGVQLLINHRNPCIT